MVSNQTASSDRVSQQVADLGVIVRRDGADLRKRLLMTLIRDDRLHTDDVRALVGLLGRTFGPGRLAGGLLQRLNPLAAA